ncbi:VWCE protein, partial [Sagittarius serpentarius]|nr:VWCE protein [Sagittarius serpentarius]
RGAPREPGARWTEPGCRSCVCQGGRVLCEAVSCSVTCSHPLPAPAGGCCPSCAGCLHEGVARAEGDVFSPSDGNCTICACLAGNVSCISPECPPGSCPSASPADCCSCQPGCFVDDNGVEFPIGQIWSPGDPCELCICQVNENLLCFTPPTCPCPGARLLSPAFPRDAGLLVAVLPGSPPPASWAFNPAVLGSPRSLSSASPLQTDGSVSCKRTDCVETCPYPIRIPGQCCPDCSAGCTYMGRIFYNNETFPSVLDPCLSCICLVR